MTFKYKVKERILDAKMEKKTITKFNTLLRLLSMILLLLVTIMVPFLMLPQ